MNNPVSTIRGLIIYSICVPLAIYLGFLLAGPMDRWAYTVYGILVFLMVLPALLRWHHVWLIVTWNSSLMFFFLPGRPQAWLLMSFLSFFICLGHYILNRQRKFLQAPAVTLSLISFGLVVLATAKLTGGLGLRMLGDETIGGKRYFYIWFAILGYFAFISQPIKEEKRNLYGTLFFGSGATQMIGELFLVVSPAFYFIFLFFPPSAGGMNTMQGQAALTAEYAIARHGGLANGAMAIALAILARYGIAGTLNLRKIWRPVLFFIFAGLSLIGGFRSIFIMVALTFAFVFWLEGLIRSRLLPAMLLLFVLFGALAFGFVDKLPLNFQRSLSVVPLLPVSPYAKFDAESSSEWRLTMWRHLVTQIPQYLIIGKGYTFNANDAALAASVTTVPSDESGFEMVGDFHNGPLSVIIPFGIFGCLTFLWFLYASMRVLWANYKYGDPTCKHLNTFLLAYFFAKMIIFFAVFGAIQGDLYVFVGLVGLSLSANRGVARRPVTAPARVVFNRFRVLPEPAPVPQSPA